MFDRFIRLFLANPASEKDDPPMWLIAGLGNPGSKYEKNRHNVGFMAVGEIAERYDFAPDRLRFNAACSEGRIADRKCALMKPQTYMNESGQSVGEYARYYNIEPDRILVIHDELDLGAGEVRLKKGGGHAGHNGIKSVQAHLGTPDFWRLRIGIGHPGHKDQVSPYVLSDFAKADAQWLEPALDNIARNMDVFIRDGAQAFMEKMG